MCDTGGTNHAFDRYFANEEMCLLQGSLPRCHGPGSQHCQRRLCLNNSVRAWVGSFETLVFGDVRHGSWVPRSLQKGAQGLQVAADEQTFRGIVSHTCTSTDSCHLVLSLFIVSRCPTPDNKRQGETSRLETPQTLSFMCRQGASLAVVAKLG